MSLTCAELHIVKWQNGEIAGRYYCTREAGHDGCHEGRDQGSTARWVSGGPGVSTIVPPMTVPTLDERDRAIGAKVRKLCNTESFSAISVGFSTVSLVYEDQTLYGNPEATDGPKGVIYAPGKEPR